MIVANPNLHWDDGLCMSACEPAHPAIVSYSCHSPHCCSVGAEGADRESAARTAIDKARPASSTESSGAGDWHFIVNCENIDTFLLRGQTDDRFLLIGQIG